MHYVKKNGLELIELESVEFQNELLASFGDELYEMQIEAMLEDPAEEGRATSELYEMYLIGDVDLTGSLTGGDPDESGEELTEREKELIEGYEKALLDDRNLGMRDKAVEMLESGKTVFYTAGLAHFLGEKGLVKLLTDEGYEVERVHIFDLVSVSA